MPRPAWAPTPRDVRVSDRHAGYVKDLPVSPDDFSATVLHAFGLPPDTMVEDQLGRPQRASEGRPLTALFG